MQRLFAVVLVLLSVPLGTMAAPLPASFTAANSLLATSSAPGNAYIAGASVVVTAPTVGDLLAVGGSVVAAGSVTGDALLAAGSVSTRAPLKGDVRATGGTISINEPVGGDLVAVGYTVTDSGRPSGSVFVIAANASLTSGAAGPVIVYGNNVLLAGDFAGDVKVIAGGSVTLAKDSVIHGKFSYEAPEQARIAATASTTGGVEYTNASYLPDAGTSRALAIASIGVFLLVRILGALILAGLLAGLFPALAHTITDRASRRPFRAFFLTTLLGFAAIVATPILLILLAITFVGFGVALLLGIGYLLLLALSFMYAGILIGTLFARSVLKREAVLWHDGVLGMLILSLIALVPIVGWLALCIFMAFTAGTLLSLFFRTAFPQE